MALITPVLIFINFLLIGQEALISMKITQHSVIRHYSEETLTTNKLMYANSGNLILAFIHVIYCHVTNHLKIY